MRALDGFRKLFGLPEWFYLREAKLGDREAFGKLYQLYMEKIYRFCYFRLGQKKEDAEDVTADVFVKAWRKLDTFTDGSFQAWLYMIARNSIIDFYRVQKRQVPLSEDFVAEGPSLVDLVATSIDTKRVQDAMKSLTHEQQEVLLMRFTEDMSHREIATILEKTEEAVRAMQYRAIKELKGKLHNE